MCILFLFPHSQSHYINNSNLHYTGRSAGVLSPSSTASTNGTYVNSESINQDSRVLNIGDIITIGDVKLKFEI